MRRRGDSKREPARTKPAQFRNQPFRGLGKLVNGAEREQSVQPPRPEPAVPVPEEDASKAFQREMADVRPLDAGSRSRVEGPPPANPARAVVNTDAEALAELSELVAGTGQFDISDSDEYVEGIVAGVDPRLVHRLRAGDFACQAHVDLHGLTVAEARAEVDRFLLRAQQAGLRCVLIVHGRGRNSKDQIPVLKNRVVAWLARGQWARLILAFTSARACDGGVGALYILLRRNRQRKRPVHVVNGAKL